MLSRSHAIPLALKQFYFILILAIVMLFWTSFLPPSPAPRKSNNIPQSFQLWSNYISLRKLLGRWKQNCGAGWTACPKKGECLRFQTPQPTPSTEPEDTPRGKATGDSPFVLWSQVEEAAVQQHCLISATGLCWMIQTLIVLPLFSPIQVNALMAIKLLQTAQHLSIDQ